VGNLKDQTFERENVSSETAINADNIDLGQDFSSVQSQNETETETDTEISREPAVLEEASAKETESLIEKNAFPENFVEKNSAETEVKTDKEELEELIAENLDAKKQAVQVVAKPIAKGTAPERSIIRQRITKRKKGRTRKARVSRNRSRGQESQSVRVRDSGQVDVVINHVPINLAKKDVVSMYLGKLLQSNEFPVSSAADLGLTIKYASDIDGLFDESVLKRMLLNPDSFLAFREKFLELKHEEDKGQSIYHEIEEMIDGKLVKVKIIPLLINGRFVYQKVYPKGVNVAGIDNKSVKVPSRSIASSSDESSNQFSFRYLDFLSAGDQALKN
jgi:hypothetical protein